MKSYLKTSVQVLFCFSVACYGNNIEELEANTAVYEVKNAWNAAFQGIVRAPVLKNSNGWTIKFTFYQPLSRFECWAGDITAGLGKLKSEFTVVNKEHNKMLKAGETLNLDFIGYFPNGIIDPQPPPVIVRFQGKEIYKSKELMGPTLATPAFLPTTDIIYVLDSLTESNRPSVTPPVTTTTATTTIDQNERNNLINQQNSRNNAENEVDSENGLKSILAGNITASQKNVTVKTTGVATKVKPTPAINITSQAKPSPKPPKKLIPVENATSKYDYEQVLHKSILFYNAQRSGKLPANNRIKWRRDSALLDRGDKGEDLTGGWYDAGDHVKFGYPMAFSLTMLAWGVIEYWEAYDAAGELENALESLRWGADYIMKAHVEPFVLYGQVGNGKEDHEQWNRAENVRQNRPAYKISKRQPGSDLAGESCAALAAVSLAIRRSANGEFTPYVGQLLRHASQLYTFATNFRRLYHLSIKDAAEYYKSTNDKDELTWMAVWMYRATGESKFLEDAVGRYNNWAMFTLPPTLRFSWDEKRPGLQMLLAQVTEYPRRYEKDVKTYCAALRSPKANYTRRGLLYLHKWSPLRYSANAAFLCLMASDAGIDKEVNYLWAKKQIHYMLGDYGRSFVVGFGRNFPKRPHHRGSSCPPRPQQCSWNAANSKKPNPIILQGALVGGPDWFDKYKDRRQDFKHSEVALDHNAGFQGAIAGLLQNVLFPHQRVERSYEPWYKEPGVTTTRPQTTSGTSRSYSTSVVTFSFPLLFSLFHFY